MYGIPAHCALNATVQAIVEAAVASEEPFADEYPTAEAEEAVERLAEAATAATASPSEAGCYFDLTQEERDDFYRFDEIVGGYLIICLGLVGLVGNALSVVVLSQREMQQNNTFNKLLIALVTFDSLHVGFAILESFRSCFPSLYPPWLLLAFPYFHFPLYRVTLCASIYMTVAVAIERFLAVCFPHDYQTMRANANRAFLYILPTVATAVALNIPKFFEIRAFTRTLWTENCTTVEVVDVEPTELRLNRNYIIIYVNWVWTMTSGVLPFFALSLLNIQIYRGLQAVQRNLGRHQRLANAAEQRVHREVAAAAAAKAKGNGAADGGQVKPAANGDAGGGTGGGKANNNNGAESVPLIAVNGPSSTSHHSLMDLDDEDDDEDETALNGGSRLSPPAPANMIVSTSAASNFSSIVTTATAIADLNSSKRNSECSVGSGGGTGAGGPEVTVSRLGGSLRQRARAAAQRRLVSAAQSREANMALVLVCTVTMFLICHLPRMFIVIFEASNVNKYLSCNDLGFRGIPLWYLYLPSPVKLLQALNASVNFPIYYFMGTAFRNTCRSLFRCKD